jgi:hypothetical protein
LCRIVDLRNELDASLLAIIDAGTMTRANRLHHKTFHAVFDTALVEGLGQQEAATEKSTLLWPTHKANDAIRALDRGLDHECVCEVSLDDLQVRVCEIGHFFMSADEPPSKKNKVLIVTF